MKNYKYILIILLLFTCSLTYLKCDNYKTINRIKNNKLVLKPLLPCQQLYYYLNKYAKQYNIPNEYCYGLTYAETRYGGPKHWKYSPNKISSCNARGALQILPSTANGIMKRKVNIDSLTNNIELNVLVGLRLLRRCKDKFGTWSSALSFYNSGQTEVNQYALNIINKNYKWKITSK